MSLQKVSETKKKSRFREWRARREFGEEINSNDIKKIVELNHILREDGKRLGIPQINIAIIPKKYEGLATASSQGYRIKGDGTLNLPTAISFDYRAIDKLSKEELRALAWHELGHYIFAYYFPDVDNKYFKNKNAYFVTEFFADEFAYKKFGNTYIRAVKKLGLLSKDKKQLKIDAERIQDLRDMGRYRRDYKKPYWMEIARQLEVEIDYSPSTKAIAGINPTKSVLRGLYVED